MYPKIQPLNIPTTRIKATTFLLLACLRSQDDAVKTQITFPLLRTYQPPPPYFRAKTCINLGPCFLPFASSFLLLQAHWLPFMQRLFTCCSLCPECSFPIPAEFIPLLPLGLYPKVSPIP